MGMQGIKHLPKDPDNDVMDRWRETWTMRVQITDEGVDIQLPGAIDSKEVWIHYEAGNVVVTRTGTVEGSQPINITDEGITEVLPLVLIGGSYVLMGATAPTGSSFYASILVGR